MFLCCSKHYFDLERRFKKTPKITFFSVPWWLINIFTYQLWATFNIFHSVNKHKNTREWPILYVPNKNRTQSWIKISPQAVTGSVQTRWRLLSTLLSQYIERCLYATLFQQISQNMTGFKNEFRAVLIKKKVQSS